MIGFDLNRSLRTDGTFRFAVEAAIGKLTETEKKARNSNRALKEYQLVLMDLLKLCNWNLSLLLPYYYPTYLSGRPLSTASHPFTTAFFEISPYLTITIKGSRQIGKSVSITARQILLSQLMSGKKIFDICPRTDQIKTFADKMKETESLFRFNTRHKNFRNNLFYKEYPNNSAIKMNYCLTNASSVRGNTASEVVIDEVQDFDSSLETEVMEIQSSCEARDIPTTIFSGTSLTTDSMLEAKWEQSSMGIWTMKCPSCKKYNQPIPEGNVMKMIQPDGPSCVHCGHLLDIIGGGDWVHESVERYNAGFKGYHVPKIIVPGIAQNPFKWNRIYMQSKEVDEKTFFQEVLGIATESGDREITQKQLEDMCTLGDVNDLQRKITERSPYRYIISGCDWGGSDYNREAKTKLSYTVHVMIGITPSYKFEIIHFQRYAGMSYDDISTAILKDHKRLGGQFIASDYGGGAVYHNFIRKHMPSTKHFIMTYTGPKTNIFAAAKSELDNHYCVNKTESITSLYEAIKHLRISCYAWDQSSKHLMQFLNLYRSLQEDAHGAATFRYLRHGSKADDALHAVNFAFILGRLIIGEPLYEDASMKYTLNELFHGPQTNLGSMGGYVSG